jgi:hypothetical protein
MDDRLRATLARTRNPDGGWPYLPGRQSRLEPTCWALLALEDVDAARTISAWRGPAGLLVEPSNPSVNYAFNGLAALTLARYRPALAEDLVAALVSIKGVRVASHPAVKQDPTLQAWPWNEGTFSWVEPTAWCTLALKKLGRAHAGSQARIDEAEMLLVDRACKNGGWNYGNTEVYGQNLYAHVPPTAMGVLAMQDRRRDVVVKQAINVLISEAPREGSSLALALAWLALTTVGAPTDGLADLLQRRIDTAIALGNLSAVAAMVYALRLSSANTQPVELAL